MRIKDTLESIIDLIDSFPVTTARKLASVTGKIVSCMGVLGPIAKLMTCFLHHEINNRSSWDNKLRISSGSFVINELFFWKINIIFFNQRKLITYTVPQVIIYSDASSTGCGAFLYMVLTSLIIDLGLIKKLKKVQPGKSLKLYVQRF